MFDLPNVTDLITNISSWATPFFSAYLPYSYLVIGILVGCMAVVWLGNVIINSVSRLFGTYGDSNDDSGISRFISYKEIDKYHD